MLKEIAIVYGELGDLVRAFRLWPMMSKKQTRGVPPRNKARWLRCSRLALRADLHPGPFRLQRFAQRVHVVLVDTGSLGKRRDDAREQSSARQGRRSSRSSTYSGHTHRIIGVATATMRSSRGKPMRQ
jgi:hypothetical protein